ncbi:MAG: NAD-dependent epimerase/dehydratase family protein [Sphingobacteriaceae bacterium]|jgi:UDP-glucose 4-epimerase
MSLKKVAIIGSNGFIGKHLTRTLINDKSLDITLFGRSATSEFASQAPYHQLDLNDTKHIAEYFKGIDLVYYLASDSIPSSSWENPKFEVERNLLPFINFLECVCKLGLKKIVFVSSAGTIYGQSTERLTEESDKKPFSPYGINKLAMENYLTYFEAKYNLKHNIFRVSNVYGIGQDTSKGLGIINTFLEKILSENGVLIYGDGKNIRNYIYVNDVAELLKLSITSEVNTSHIFNLASDDTLSINELIDHIKKVVGTDFKINYKETRQSDNPAIIVDNTKIKKAHPEYKFTPIQEGILKTFTRLKETQSIKNN